MSDVQFVHCEEPTLLGCPYDTGGCSCGVESGVGLVAFVRGAELSVDAGAELCLVWASVHIRFGHVGQRDVSIGGLRGTRAGMEG